ncbi:MAG: hypothetical protein QM619_02590 [Micropruina sp.]|uniref:hypothetical protein n=1 Tax=Micropruina sp. TaxID=2737536 RepID=UPI0039E48CF5
MRTTLNVLRIAVVTCIVALCTLVPSAPAANAAQQCIGTTTNGHGGPNAYSGDCVFMRVYTAYDGRIIVQYWGNQNYDFYQLRWSRPGRAESQGRVPGSGEGGGWWGLRNAWWGTPYTFKVQACRSSFFGSNCTSWDQVTYYRDAREVWA